jgi:hypothetical protein
VKADPRVTHFINPLRDGTMVIRKK